MPGIEWQIGSKVLEGPPYRIARNGDRETIIELLKDVANRQSRFTLEGGANVRAEAGRLLRELERDRYKSTVHASRFLERVAQTNVAEARDWYEKRQDVLKRQAERRRKGRL